MPDQSSNHPLNDTALVCLTIATALPQQSPILSYSAAIDKTGFHLLFPRNGFLSAPPRNVDKYQLFAVVNDIFLDCMKLEGICGSLLIVYHVAFFLCSLFCLSGILMEACWLLALVDCH